MPLVTTTTIVDDSDGVTVIDPDIPHVEIVDGRSGQRLFFVDWNAVAVYAAAQQPAFAVEVAAVAQQVSEAKGALTDG